MVHSEHRTFGCLTILWLLVENSPRNLSELFREFKDCEQPISPPLFINYLNEFMTDYRLHSFLSSSQMFTPNFKETNPLMHNAFTLYCLVIYSTQFTMDACCWQNFVHQKSYYTHLSTSDFAGFYISVLIWKDYYEQMYWVIKHVTKWTVLAPPLLLVLHESWGYFPNSPCISFLQTEMLRYIYRNFVKF